MTVGFHVKAVIMGKYVRNIADRKYMGVLTVFEADGSSSKCGAIIIETPPMTLFEKKKILTAAHCLEDAVRGTLTVGTIDPFNGGTSINITKDQWVLHKSYVRKIFYYDIAAIILDEDLPFNQSIGDIEMVDSNYPLESTQTVTAIGYSKLSVIKSRNSSSVIYKPKIGHLQCVDVKIISTKECAARYMDTLKFDIYEHMFICIPVFSPSQDRYTPHILTGDSGGNNYY